MASRHENPGRSKNDNFLKTLYKISALFQISSEIKKGAAQTRHEFRKTISNWLQNWEEINGNSKISVNISPRKFKYYMCQISK